MIEIKEKKKKINFFQFDGKDLKNLTVVEIYRMANKYWKKKRGMTKKNIQLVQTV